MPLSQPLLRVVISEEVAAAPLTPNERYGLVSALLEQGVAVSLTTGDGGPSPPHDGAPLVILGGSREGFTMRGTNPARQQLEKLPSPLDPGEFKRRVALLGSELAAATPGAWKPWFPVIDYGRCTQCMQCLSFCLFGVYGVDQERRLTVENPDNCKTNCPACSRVCPEAAIMFPKYKTGPINGDTVTAADVNREKMKVDISALLGGNIYEMLRNRSETARTRFSRERDSDKALVERRNCLAKLALDLPPEVLMSLPSAEEIARRAEEAAARAKAALGARAEMNQ